MENNKMYHSYNAMVSDISNGLQRVAEICEELNMQETEAALERSEEKMKRHKFSIGILGEFKRGKSTVINALLGREIMPSDILPTSATMNRVTYGMEPEAQVHMRAGAVETIDVDQLIDYVTKLDDEKAAKAELVEEAIVFYPCKFCQNGVDIVDTPGLNDEGRMDKVVEEVIPKLDAVIMVITPDSPFSMSEAEFVRSKLMTSDIGRLIFLINKFDIVRKRDQQRVLKEIRSRIEKSVLEKMREIHGADSETYKDVQSKLANIRIFPISARDALEGRMEDDEEVLANSGMLAFEETLGKMLTEERGALELGMPIAQIYRSCDMALEMIGNCRAALDCSEDQFQQAQRSMLSETKALKESQNQKKRDLNARSKAVKRELSAKAASCYDTIEEKAHQIIEQIRLEDPKQALTDETKQSIIDQASQKINEMSRREMRIFSEQIINALDEIVGKESLKVAALISQYEVHLGNACLLTGMGQDATSTLAAIAVDTIGPLWGLGGVIAGYKAAGVKGALIGGGTAFASSIAIVTLLSPLNIVGIPLAMIAAAGSTLAGKAVCNAIFAKSRNEKILSELKNAIRNGFTDSYNQMRKDREIEKWIYETVEGQFNLLINSMDEECTRVINQANETIGNIQMESARSAAEKSKRMQDYDRMQATILDIKERLMPLREKVTACIAY